MKFIFLILLCFLTSCGFAPQINTQDKLVIAHRGASGYLPEHSIAAKAMAHAMNADYIEQDVVMSKDNQLLILHDHYLDRVTNVATVFPNRKRQDGRYYAIDFTLTEIRTLKMTEGFSVDESGQQKAGFPERFPLWKSTFAVHTLAEEIELIQGLNKSTGKNIGIYVEIKSPAFHLHEGKDISKAVLKELKRYGYDKTNDKVFLQSFDAIDLQRIKKQLLPELNMQIKLVQLIAMTDWQETLIYQQDSTSVYNYDWMLQPSSMQKIATYADGIGPWKPMLVDSKSKPVKSNGLLEAAHKAGLVVHPYTFRADSGRIPEYAQDFDDLLKIFYFDIGVDGVFTDFPDKAVQFLQTRR
ncbi:glycerophosphodiester phosphodiesterase [Psychrosphaera saromensis]|uniref:glycerophosphodiester phosphodiesterase n=1 Tax=Psychrosphaera saromensis TaxID=716813 RepID=A0A2S7USV5_9GAMM|nr:glycerophosphodiester phosphodiesterase [Psychrosphaera saromensis]PQJ52361.1 glycerophosphodiester phosphodiesterase [Psychrosphaera saromensis]GHB73142.1 glycerophosphodiester phosphodiesterase [Psychrosphaera saromensis]GLQ13476.1 glycerophosphodiester phosphodiesterase [Psychrosphaera saromensis]